MVKLFGVLCLIFLISRSSCAKVSKDAAGIKMMINDKGLEKSKDIISALLSKTISSLNIPDVEDREGRFMYTLSSMEVKNFTLGQTSLETSPPNIVTISTTGASISLGGDFWAALKFWVFTLPTDGKFIAKASNISISLSVQVGKDSKGGPTVVIESCSSSVRNISLKTSGSSLDRVINSFLENADDSIADFVSDMICPLFKKIFQEKVDQLIQSVGVSFAFGSSLNTSISFALLQPPAMEDNRIEVALSGRCFPENNPSLTFNVSRPALPELPSTTSMFQVLISEYTANTLLQSITHNGILNISFTAEELANLLNLDISVQSLIFLVPCMASHASRPFKIVGFPFQSPRFDIQSNNIAFSFNYSITLQVIQEDSSTIDIAYANMQGKVNINLKMTKDQLTATLQISSLDILESSCVDANSLKFLINFFTSSNNDIFTQKFDLSTIYGFFGIEKSQIYSLQNAVAVESDITLIL